MAVATTTGNGKLLNPNNLDIVSPGPPNGSQGQTNGSSMPGNVAESPPAAIERSPSTTTGMQPAVVDQFLYWVRERESIRQKRERGLPGPWTKDPVLHNYRFCNVRRMDDRVSRWLHENWYLPHAGHPRMLFACAMARIFNVTETLALLGFPRRWEPAKVEAKLRQLFRLRTIYSGAYIITGRLDDTRDKIWQSVYLMLDPLWQERLQPKSTMSATWAMLNGRAGYGSFMAGQVTADLRHAGFQFSDNSTWACPGPGSLRGLGHLYGYAVNEHQFSQLFPEVLKLVRTRTPKIWAERQLEAFDVQNCLCEFDKYYKGTTGKRMPKRRYP